MMRISLLTLTIVLAACSGPDQNTQETAKETVAEGSSEIAQTAYDGGPNVGVFEAVSTEGVVLRQTAAADGSIVSVDGEGNAVNGTYTMGEGRFCIANEGEDAASCYAYSNLTDDGSWTATNVDDPADSWTVKRVSAD